MFFETISVSPWCLAACWSRPLISSGRSIIRPSMALLAQHVAEQHPLLAVEALELHRLDRREVVAAGGDADPGQQGVDAKALHVGRLLHDVLARQVVAALLEDLGDGRAHRVAVDVENA